MLKKIIFVCAVVSLSILSQAAESLSSLDKLKQLVDGEISRLDLGDPSLPAVLKQKITTVEQAIGEMNSADLSCTSDTDCTAVALGERACGGPEKYIVVSTKNSNYQSILFWSYYDQQHAKVFNKVAGLFSICSIQMPPAGVCMQNKCSEK